MTTSILAPKVRRTARPSLQDKVRLRPRPLCEGDWSTLPAGKRGPAVIAFGDVLESLVPAAAKMKAGEIRFCKPSFYADAHLWEIDVQIAGAFAGVLDLLVQSDRITVLNGTSPPIYRLNSLSGVMLETPEQAKDYIAFFCNAVHGEVGSFAIFSSWLEIGRLNPQRKDLLDALSGKFPDWLDIKLSPVANPEEGIWQACTSIFYAGQAFRSTLQLHATGMIHMVEDKLVSGDLSLAKTVYRRGLRRLD